MASAVDLNEYGEILTHANLAQFLATQEWALRGDYNHDQVWLPSQPGERVVPVLLPREPTFSDYTRRLQEAVHDIAQAFGWRIAELAEQVAAIHADLFFVRVDQSSADGTIPFHQAANLLDGIEQMVRSAALTAYNPASGGRGGRVPTVVKDFMNDDLRMGHTKKGSFIITVAARLETSAADTSAPATDIGSKASFTRQVMTQLAQSVEATRKFTQRGDDFVDLEQALQIGMRLPLVRALHDMGDGDGVRALDMSFEWAASEPQLEGVPERVVLQRETIDLLPAVEKRLLRRFEPATITVVGPVTELKRSNAESGETDDTHGEIVVRGDVNGRLSRITVPLSGDDYDWAIQAHRRRLPFTVSGELGRKGNSWRLDEPIAVDHSFLEFELNRSRSAQDD